MNAIKSLVLACSMAALPSLAMAREGVPPTDEQRIGTLRAGVLKGYLAPSALPDSHALLAPPPADGSPAAAADIASHQAALAWAGKEGWDRARKDSDLSKEGAAAAFSQVLGFLPDDRITPHLAVLLRRVMADAGMATVRAKDAYDRVRPFVQSKTATCTPAEDASLARSGSYPSGHAATGWAWALVLTEVVPSKANELLRRGLEIGGGRVACLAHWQSDVDAGRLVAAGVVAALHTDPVFRAQLVLARREAARQQKACAAARDTQGCRATP